MHVFIYDCLEYFIYYFIHFVVLPLFFISFPPEMYQTGEWVCSIASH